VVQDYGWGHSLALGGDLRKARAATPQARLSLCTPAKELTSRRGKSYGDSNGLESWMKAPCLCMGSLLIEMALRSCVTVGLPS
jgi:hypothetical protein